MSRPAAASLIARPSWRYVSFGPGGPDTARRCALIRAGLAEHARTAARNARLAASNAVPSKPVYGFAPLTWAFHSRSNAAFAGAPSDVPAVPRSPFAGAPIF